MLNENFDNIHASQSNLHDHNTTASDLAVSLVLSSAAHHQAYFQFLLRTFQDIKRSAL